MYWINISFLLFISIFQAIFSAPAKNIEDGNKGPQVSYRDADVRRNPFQTQNFWSNGRYKWPRGALPYILSPLYTTSERNIILRAIAEWEKKTCVRFIPRQRQHTDYVEITPDDGTSSYCYSHVGRQGGRQRMKMFGECLRHAAMIHELGHAIGMNHEHQRPDRDDFINVHLKNVDPVYHYAFDKYSYSVVDNLNTPYDYKSVMQYPYYAFTKNDPNRPGMTLKDGSIDAIRYEAKILSVGDINKIRLYYNNCN